MKPAPAARAMALLLALGLGLAACGRRQEAGSPSTTAADPPSAREPSLYALDLQLTDQDGHTHALADLRGQVLVAAMMYSSCETVCPRVTEDMKSIERQLGSARRDTVGFVLFSLDPGRDTPAALRAFARSHGLDSSRWRLLAASEDGVRELAAALGVKYVAEENGEIAHSAMIFLIDRDGVVRHRQVGVEQEPHELLEALASVIG